MTGFCRNFPRVLVFGPKKYHGLGLTHIFYYQEIARLHTLIDHTAHDTFTGRLYRVSLENLMIEGGLGDNILDLPYHTLSPLTPNSLIKNTWSFLSRHGLKQKHDIKVEGFRQGDQPIMQVLFNKGVTINELVQINRYQLFLNVYYASKILMGYGNQVRPFLLQRAKGQF